MPFLFELSLGREHMLKRTLLIIVVLGAFQRNQQGAVVFLQLTKYTGGGLLSLEKGAFG
jgi:hypothetical protein